MDFTMLTRNRVGPGVDPETLDILFEGCRCTGPCSTSSDCSCLQFNKDNYNDNKIILREATDLPILECHPNCACVKECGNRNVSLGMKVAVEPFFSEEKGYGLKAKDGIEQGQFVVEYTGEVIGVNEAKTRSEINKKNGDKHNYIFTVMENLKDRIETTFIDATKYGNLSRFINHSCDPNLTPFVVRSGQVSPRLALFANRAIKAGEELSYDYGQLSAKEGGGKQCHCGASSCRGFLPFGGYDSE